MPGGLALGAAPVPKNTVETAVEQPVQVTSRPIRVADNLTPTGKIP
jgi:hypothetical protein